MAIDLCSESPSLTTSPRISFSHDLHNPDDQIIPFSNHETHPPRSDPSLISDSNFEFNFCVWNTSIEIEVSSADELFSGGLIRPQQIQPRCVRTTTGETVSLSNPRIPIPAIPTSGQSTKNPQPKSIWGIKRSSSLHCDNSSHKKSSFWSLPLLSRSNSTGSVPKAKDRNRQNPSKQTKLFRSSSSSSSSSSSLSQKQLPVRKNYGGGGGGVYGINGVRISPVLNVPPPFIYRATTNLFGLGSLFRNTKDKKNKK